MTSVRLKALTVAGTLALALAACSSQEDTAAESPAPEEAPSTEAAPAAPSPQETGTPSPVETSGPAGENTAADGEGPDDVLVTFLGHIHAGDCDAAHELAHIEDEQVFDEGCTVLHEQFSTMTFDPTVDEVTADGDTAKVTATVDGLSEDISMIRVDGEWKVDMETGY